MKRLTVILAALVLVFGFVGGAGAYSSFADVKDWTPFKAIWAPNPWLPSSYSYTHDLSFLTETIVDAKYDLDFTNVGWVPWYRAVVEVSFNGGDWITGTVGGKDDEGNLIDHLYFDLADYIGVISTNHELTVTVRVTSLRGLPWTACIKSQTVSGHTAIPLPGALWLFGSGLIALVGLRRRDSRRQRTMLRTALACRRNWV